MAEQTSPKNRTGFECLCGNWVVFEIDSVPNGATGKLEIVQKVAEIRNSGGMHIPRCPRCGREVTPERGSVEDNRQARE